jgi:hypothetical protein
MRLVRIMNAWSQRRGQKVPRQHVTATPSSSRRRGKATRDDSESSVAGAIPDTGTSDSHSRTNPNATPNDDKRASTRRELECA